MIYTLRAVHILATIALLVNGATAQTISNCHPYPGAVAPDCLTLISNNFGNDTALSCTNGPKTITLGACSIVTKCTDSTKTPEFTPDDVVRRALTVIGRCALSDRGSISGWYLAEDGAKTCYLYPGR
jgi:hypothetical protein